jgi:hypothetical protein
MMKNKTTGAGVAAWNAPETVKAVNRILRGLCAGRISPLESRRQFRALGLGAIDTISARVDRMHKRTLKKIGRRVDKLAARLGE